MTLCTIIGLKSVFFIGEACKACGRRLCGATLRTRVGLSKAEIFDFAVSRVSHLLLQRRQKEEIQWRHSIPCPCSQLSYHEILSTRSHRLRPPLGPSASAVGPFRILNLKDFCKHSKTAFDSSKAHTHSTGDFNARLDLC